MPIAAIANYAAIAVYLGTVVYLLFALKRQRPPATAAIAVPTAVALVLQAAGMQGAIFVAGGINASIFVLPNLFFWTVNLIVLVSGLRKALYNLFIFLFPLTCLAILSTVLKGDAVARVSPAVGHILLALLASGFLTLATLQALVLAFQNYQLKHKHATGIVRLLPPLQTMESLMFELLWIGQVMLTLLIVSGLLILQDIFAQQQAHTLAFSILAWIVYAILLWGRHRLGWRGNTAIRWVLGGFAILLLAYMGTQLVYQVILKP